MTPPSLFEQAYSQRTDDDVRFEFEIIKGLSDSVRKQTEIIGRIQEQQTEMLVSLARIESNRVDQRVSALETEVTNLKQERDRREGRDGAIAMIFRSPAIGWLFGAAAMVYVALGGKVNL